MDNHDDLLTTAEVAQITRSPVSTLRYWRHLGTGPHSFRLGRRVVYRRADVAAWLLEQDEVKPRRTRGLSGESGRRPGVVPGIRVHAAQKSRTLAASALTTCRPK
jgi:predicted DNA-binding transcriptional regulator AlpA